MGALELALAFAEGHVHAGEEEEGEGGEGGEGVAPTSATTSHSAPLLGEARHGHLRSGSGTQQQGEGGGVGGSHRSEHTHSDGSKHNV